MVQQLNTELKSFVLFAIVIHGISTRNMFFRTDKMGIL